MKNLNSAGRRAGQAGYPYPAEAPKAGQPYIHLPGGLHQAAVGIYIHPVQLVPGVGAFGVSFGDAGRNLRPSSSASAHHHRRRVYGEGAAALLDPLHGLGFQVDSHAYFRYRVAGYSVPQNMGPGPPKCKGLVLFTAKTGTWRLTRRPRLARMGPGGGRISLGAINGSPLRGQDRDGNPQYIIYARKDGDMPIINIVPPEKAEGQVKENYAFFDPLGMVPAPYQMYSPSPALQTARKGVMSHFLGHHSLSDGLLALIRMLVAEEMGYHYCVSFNRGLVRRFGITDDDRLGAVMADPASAPLGDKDKAMLLFVLKAIKTPEAVEQADVQTLRDLGWSDGDMVDAVAHGASMVADGIMFKAFKMDEGESC